MYFLFLNDKRDMKVVDQILENLEFTELEQLKTNSR